MMRGSIVVLAMLVASAACAAEELDRLFLTPEQRSALDARRKARVPDKPAAAAVIAPVTRIDGYVRRENGASTIWLNGEAVTEGGRNASGPRIETQRSGPPEVSLPAGEDPRGARARVGQTIDSSTGEVRDSLGEKAISVRRLPEKR